jgi:hypothetical protein
MDIVGLIEGCRLTKRERDTLLRCPDSMLTGGSDERRGGEEWCAVVQWWLGEDERVCRRVCKGEGSSEGRGGQGGRMDGVCNRAPLC